MIEFYVKLKILCIKIRNTIRFLKFSARIFKGNIFRDGNPQLVLRVIQEFISIESVNYENILKNNRTVEESNKLLSTLIDNYFETKSERTLNQLLEVLKEEFIKRKFTK